MNDFTKEEQELLIKLARPALNLQEIEAMLDGIAIRHGFENYKDFLSKSGWMERFCLPSFDEIKNQGFKSYESMSIGFRGDNE